MVINLFVAVLVVMIVAMLDFSRTFLDEDSERLLYFEADDKIQTETQEESCGTEVASEEDPVLVQSSGQEPTQESTQKQVKPVSEPKFNRSVKKETIIEPACITLDGLQEELKKAQIEGNPAKKSGGAGQHGRVTVKDLSGNEIDLDAVTANFIEEVYDDLG